MRRIGHTAAGENESGVTFRIAITRGCEKSNKGLFAAMAENPVEFDYRWFEVFLATSAATRRVPGRTKYPPGRSGGA